MPMDLQNADPLDLALAAEFQRALLPELCPELPQSQGACGGRMCGYVGGDFYDIIRLNDEQIALLIGDVVGHGVRAALLMAKIMGMLRAGARQAARPAHVGDSINTLLLELGQRAGSALLCTLFYAVMDNPSQTLFFINAGHPPPLILGRSSGRIVPTGATDPPLGVDEIALTEMCGELEPGGRLVLYTDGLLDVTDPQNQLFGRRRLEQALQAGAQDPPLRALESVFQEIDLFADGSARRDDQSLVLLDRL